MRDPYVVVRGRLVSCDRSRHSQATRSWLTAAVAALVAACAPDSSSDEAAHATLPHERSDRGQYAAPVVQLQQLVGRNLHLHTDEVRYRASDGMLFHCSYDFGAIDARDPENMVYLVEGLRHTVPGDDRTPGCIHLAWDGDFVYTVHRGNIDNPAFLSGWELRDDPADPNALDPVQLPVLQEPGVSYEGIDAADGRIYVALRQNGLGIYRHGADGGFERIGTASDLHNAWGVRVRGTIAFVSDGLSGLAIVDVADPSNPTLLGRAMTGGQARGLALDGDIAYVAAGPAGLVVVDVSDLTDPKVIGRAEVPGSAIRVDYARGHAYVAAWNDARVYDVSEPAAPRFVAAARLTRDIGYEEEGRPAVTSRTLGIAAHEDVMFVGNWHLIYSYRVHPDRTAPSILLPEDINLIDFGPVAAGDRTTVPLAVTNQGTAPLSLFDNSTDHPAFVVEPRQVRIAPGETATLSLTYSASTTEQETAFLQLRSDDPISPVRTGYLAANRPGVGIGKPLPETRVSLVDGGEWSSSQFEGQIMLLAYFATF